MARQLARRHADAVGSIAASKLSSVALERKLGPDPSIEELVAGMADMHEMVKRQAEVEVVVLQMVSFDVSCAQLAEILKFLQGAPAACLVHHKSG
jgi:hypothetical protein